MDAEAKFLLFGWTYTLIGLFFALLCVIHGLIILGLIFIFIVAFGFTTIIYSFVVYQVPQVPEYIEFWKGQWLAFSVRY